MPSDEPRRLSLRSATRPITEYFDKRFTDLHRHLDHRLDVIEQRLERIEDALGRLGALGASATGASATGGAAESASEAGDKAARFEELSARLERFADEFATRAERIAEAYEAAAGTPDAG
jgi:hypothetical protein